MGYRQRTTVVASRTETATGTSSTVAAGVTPELGDLILLVDVTAASGTSPTLDLTVEYLMDGGTTFAKGDPADAFTQIVAAGVAVKSFVLKGTAYRIAWAIAGTTPSFIFSIDEIRR